MELNVEILVNFAHNSLITFAPMKKLMLSFKQKYPFIGPKNPKEVAKKYDVVVVADICTQG